MADRVKSISGLLVLTVSIGDSLDKVVIEWVKSLFGMQETENSSSQVEQDNDLLEHFEILLADRMKLLHPDVKDAFAPLLDTGFSDDINGLTSKDFSMILPFVFGSWAQTGHSPLRSECPAWPGWVVAQKLLNFLSA